MLVVQGKTAIGQAFLHQMPQMEERTKKTSQRTRKEGVLWQALAERRLLAGLLANEKAVAPTGQY